MEKVEELSLIEKIGQLFLIGLEENKITNATKEMILKYKIGGFILYKKNYKNYHEMLKIINELKEIIVFHYSLQLIKKADVLIGCQMNFII